MYFYCRSPIMENIKMDGGQLSFGFQKDYLLKFFF